ncbi:MAG: hypothetical protein M5T61_09900 [Acidimicrobiia bacterium]|nr:hypothetical protein [Acidimicrobiia bacterium]
MRASWPWMRQPQRARPGVVVLTAADLTNLDHAFGVALRDQPIVAIDRVRFVGDPVAAVAADTPEAAEAALEFIDVEYEPLETVMDPEAAAADDAPVLHPVERHEHRCSSDGPPSASAGVSTSVRAITWSRATSMRDLRAPTTCSRTRTGSRRSTTVTSSPMPPWRAGIIAGT